MKKLINKRKSSFAYEISKILVCAIAVFTIWESPLLFSTGSSQISMSWWIFAVFTDSMLSIKGRIWVKNGSSFSVGMLHKSRLTFCSREFWWNWCRKLMTGVSRYLKKCADYRRELIIHIKVPQINWTETFDVRQHWRKWSWSQISSPNSEINILNSMGCSVHNSVSSPN
jgi:hypothetical protein